MIVFGMILLYAGVGLTIVAVIALFRFPDVYIRVKGAALLNMPAAIFIHVASSLLLAPFAEGGLRGLVTAFLFLLSGPVQSHTILLAAHLINVPRNYHVDDLQQAPHQEPRGSASA